jgi:hypothetical protein
MSENNPSAMAIVRECLRPLEWDELVMRGDFVQDANLAFQPWEGPSGFRAGTFVMQIYRRLDWRQTVAKKRS